MRWEDERYVRLYTKDTPTWVMFPWQAKACLPLILRKCDRAGIIDLGEEGMEGLAATIGLPLAIVEVGVEALARKRTIVLQEDRLIFPKFMEAQETPQSDAARQRAKREKDRDVALALSRAVTGCHVESRGVTPNLTVPCLTEPSKPEERNAAVAAQSPLFGDALEVVPNSPAKAESAPAETEPKFTDAARQVFEHWRAVHGNPPGAKFTADRQRKVVARLRDDGYTVEQLKRAVDGNAADPWFREKRKHDLELICRTGAKVEDFIARASESHGKGPGLPQEPCGACGEPSGAEFHGARLCYPCGGQSTQLAGVDSPAAMLEWIQARRESAA